MTPKEFVNASEEAISQYRNAMGTLISLGIMLYTNFKIDAPYTNKLTNFLLENPATLASIKKFAGVTNNEGGPQK